MSSFLLKNAAFQYFTLGFRAAVYKADSSHYGCPVPKNPLTNQVRFFNSFYWTQQSLTQQKDQKG